MIASLIIELFEADKEDKLLKEIATIGQGMQIMKEEN
jgi:hypothetical protein